VGKYGPQTQALLKKAAGLDIAVICPLHGPVLKENLGYYVNLYDIWSSYKVESEGVVIAYTSVYGNTKKAVELLAQKLTENLGHYLSLYNTWSSYAVETDGIVVAYTSVYGNTKKAVELFAEKLKRKGCPNVIVHDLARCDMAQAISDAFRYGKLVLATTTYNADVFPFMHTFIHGLTERNFQNRTIGLIENGSWAPQAAKVMKEMFAKSKNLKFTDTTVRIMSALN
jgi:flavorubredoxin